MLRLVKKTALIFLLVSQVAMANQNLSQECFNPNPVGCDFYDQCLDKKITCGPNGYAISYGKRYCEILSTINTPNSPAKGELSPAGIKWRDAVRTCLQLQLFPILTSDWEISCKGVRAFAFNTHPTCYVLPGNSFCELPKKDWLVFFSAFKNPEVNREAFEQMLKLAINCISMPRARSKTTDYEEKKNILNKISY